MLWRKGLWVICEKRVGILVAFDALAGEVHLVDKKGETVEIVAAKLRTLVQARHADIPLPRRPDKRFAAKLGYA